MVQGAWFSDYELWMVNSPGTFRASVTHVIARRYPDLECWQLANELKLRVYAFTAIEPAAWDRKYCAQIRDAARSAPRNIAEGFGRFWPREFAQFLDTRAPHSWRRTIIWATLAT